MIRRKFERGQSSVEFGLVVMLAILMFLFFPVPAKYFVIRILSSDPAKWGDNKLVKTLNIKPPSGAM